MAESISQLNLMLLVILLAGSFGVTFLVTPFIISFAKRKNLYDIPTGDRLKVHETPIPYLGGFGIFIGFIFPIILFSINGQISAKVLGILVPSTVVLILGFWDDLRNIKPITRLIWQLLAGSLTIWSGIRIATFPTYFVAIPLTIFYILGSINAMNLIDGLDGLAGGVVCISLVGFSIFFYLESNMILLIISASLLGSILGFLPYNFSRAKIFMGDNGSTLLGYLIAVLAISASSEPYHLLHFIIPMLFIGLPILDTSLAIGRRALKGQPILDGDRSHLYDQLVGKGFSVKKTVLFCYSMQCVLVLSGLLLFFFSGRN